MMASSVGFSMDLHYCQNNIQSVSLIGKAKSCEKIASHSCENSGNECHSNSKSSKNASCHSSISKDDSSKDCCHNKTIKVENLDEDTLVSSFGSIEITQLQFLIAFINAFYATNNFEALPLKSNLYYLPPLIEKDLQVLFQSFLI